MRSFFLSELWTTSSFWILGVFTLNGRHSALIYLQILVSVMGQGLDVNSSLRCIGEGVK